jgi:hypothetical protein
MSHKKFSILNAMIVSSLGTGALLHAADSQLPVSPFIVPPPGKAGAGNTPATTGNSPAPTPDNGPQFTGFVDTTYNYDLNRPLSGVNKYYSFDAQDNTIALNNAQLELTGAPKGDAAVTYMLKINFGTDATAESSTVNGVATNTSNLDVEEAWGWYVDPVSKVGLKVGKFVTYEGTEVIESINDPTVTRGLLFSNLEPYTHTGALLTWTGTVMDYAVGMVNGWDELTASDSGKTAVAKMGVTLGDPLALTVSALYGPQQVAAPAPANPAGADSNKRGSIDITGLTKLIPKWQVNFQANFGWEKNAPGAVAAAIAAGTTVTPNSQSTWFGLGTQPVYAWNPTTNVAFRIELLDDLDGARTGLKQEIWSFSIAPGTNITPHFLLRAEARLDVSNNDKAYTDHAGNQVKIQSTLAGEAIYNF